MCLKTIGASLIISITKFNYKDLYLFSTSILHDYIDIFLNSKNYYYDNNNVLKTQFSIADNYQQNVTFHSNYSSSSSKNNNNNNCDKTKYSQEILSVSLNTTAIITIQKSHHFMLIKMKL